MTQPHRFYGNSWVNLEQQTKLGGLTHLRCRCEPIAWTIFPWKPNIWGHYPNFSDGNELTQLKPTVSLVLHSYISGLGTWNLIESSNACRFRRIHQHLRFHHQIKIMQLATVGCHCIIRRSQIYEPKHSQGIKHGQREWEKKLWNHNVGPLR